MFNDEKGLRVDKKGDLVIQSKHQSNSAVIGMLLGDGSMTRYVLKKADSTKISIRHNSRVQFSLCHSVKQAEYLLWKESLLRAYIKFGKMDVYSPNDREDLVYYKKTSLVGHTRHCIYLYEKFYSTGRKIVNKKLLNRLSNLGLAIWFMDDGSLIPHSFTGSGDIRALKLRLHTCCFSYDEHLVMKDYFSRHGIDFYIYRDKKYYSLATGKKESISRFIEKVRPFVEMVDCMRYKISPYDNFISTNCPSNFNEVKGNDIVCSV